MKTILLPPLYMAPASYYAAMIDADYVVIDTALRYDRRRKEVHRTIVDGAHGQVYLTVPVARPRGTNWSDTPVSDHGRWWHVHQSTLATLFGPTPYFNYYKHDICHSLDSTSVGQPITDLDINIDTAIRRLLGITARMSVTLDPNMTGEIMDMRTTDFFAQDMPPSLYPGRSILRALFELGADEVRRLLCR